MGDECSPVPPLLIRGGKRTATRTVEDIVHIKDMYDGDLCLLIDNKTMINGVDRDAPVVIDVEDKITALAEEDTPETRVALVLRTINSLIGETSK